MIARLTSAFSSRHSANRIRKSQIAIRPHLPVVEPMESRTFLSVVLPGSTVPTPGTTVAARPELAGTVIYDNLIPITLNDSSGNLVYSGMLQDRVVKENVSGTLDFYQSLRGDLPANGPAFQSLLQNVARVNFTGFSTDVDWRIDGLGNPPISPTTATRSAAGNAVVFDFNKPISNGQASYFYMIKTNATSFDVGGHTLLSFGSPAAAISVAHTIVSTAEPIGQPVTNPNNPTGGFGGTITVNPGPNGGAAEPLADTDVTLKISRGSFSLIIIVKTDDAGHYQVNGLAPGHYDVQVLNPQGALGANGGDAHGNDTAGMMDVVVKPNSSADGVDFDLPFIGF